MYWVRFLKILLRSKNGKIKNSVSYSQKFGEKHSFPNLANSSPSQIMFSKYWVPRCKTRQWN